MKEGQVGTPSAFDPQEANLPAEKEKEGGAKMSRGVRYQMWVG